jgi:hypothetical protein
MGKDALTVDGLALATIHPYVPALFFHKKSHGRPVGRACKLGHCACPPSHGKKGAAYSLHVSGPENQRRWEKKKHKREMALVIADAI